MKMGPLCLELSINLMASVPKPFDLPHGFLLHRKPGRPNERGLHWCDQRRPTLGLTQPSNYLTLKGSFSAVSKPIFASIYALELAYWKALAEIYKMHSFTPFSWDPSGCTVLESIIENWGKKDLAKTTPKKEKTRKRDTS